MVAAHAHARAGQQTTHTHIVATLHNTTRFVRPPCKRFIIIECVDNNTRAHALSTVPCNNHNKYISSYIVVVVVAVVLVAVAVVERVSINI